MLVLVCYNRRSVGGESEGESEGEGEGEGEGERFETVRSH